MSRIWSSKDYLNHHGKPLFAELVILRMLEKDGWEGIRVNNFSRQFLKGMPKNTPPCKLPAEAQRMFDRIVQENGRRRGCWDVFA